MNRERRERGLKLRRRPHDADQCTKPQPEHIRTISRYTRYVRSLRITAGVMLTSHLLALIHPRLQRLTNQLQIIR